jgi:uncharacterized protein (TIGR02246 family)
MLDAADRLAILETLARFHETADAQDLEAQLALYLPDAEFVHGDTVKGHDALRAALPGVMAGTLKRHCAANVIIDGDEAAVLARYTLLVFEGETAPQLVATSRVLDRLERHSDRWRLARHEVIVDPNLGRQLTATPTAEGGT